MKESIIDYISNLADIERSYIEMDMSFDELNIDIIDIKELLSTIEDDLGIENASELLSKLNIESTLNELIELLEVLE